MIKKNNAHRQLKIFKRTIPQSNATNWFAKCARTKCFICGIKQSEYKLKEKAETNNNNNRDKLRNLGRKKNHCWIFRHFSNCLNVINSCGRSCLMTNLYLRNLVPLMTALFSSRPPFHSLHFISFYSAEKQLLALYSTFPGVLEK